MSGYKLKLIELNFLVAKEAKKISSQNLVKLQYQVV